MKSDSFKTQRVFAFFENGFVKNQANKTIEKKEDTQRMRERKWELEDWKSHF